MNDDANKNNADEYRINNKTIKGKSFEYKTEKIGNIPADNKKLDTEVIVSLKHLSNFWRFLDLPLVNCEIEIDLKGTSIYSGGRSNKNKRSSFSNK